MTVLDAFDAAAIDYALCGGVAVALHGYPRFTKDIDVLIRQDDLERARHALKLRGYSLDAGILAFAEGRPTERRVYCVSRAENAEILTVDLVLVTPILDEVWMDRDVFEWNGRQVRVVSARGLAIMKRWPGDLRTLSTSSSWGWVMTRKTTTKNRAVDMTPAAIDLRLRELAKLYRLGVAMRGARRLGRLCDVKPTCGH